MVNRETIGPDQNSSETEGESAESKYDVLIVLDGGIWKAYSTYPIRIGVCDSDFRDDPITATEIEDIPIELLGQE